MPITQFYETTVLDTTSSLDFKYITLPSHAIVENLRDSLVPLKLKALKLERIEDIPIELIPTIIFSIIAENDKTHVFNYLGYLLERKRDGYFFHKDIFDIPAYQFAKHLTFSRVVHVEQSPLELESIVNLVTKASWLGLGAYVGLVAAGDTPMLFITVPAGIILCGAASGIAKALEGGLRERLMKIIIGESRKQTLGSRRKRALRLTKAKKQNQFK